MGTVSEMDVADFLRLHHLRGPQIMWLLGAGASASAGVPTAGDLIWRFKLEIYCSRERQPIAAYNLGEPAVRALLQDYFDSLGAFPVAGANDEYAAFFEAAYPSEAARRIYLDPFIKAARHSFGHKVLAALMATNHLHLLWTTNFDRCVEDAAALIFDSTSALAVADLDAPHRALEAISEERWPLLGKLHGDFQSRRLKNTTEELRRQDAQLREALVSSCQTHGLSVIGYSGRDASVMETLATALQEPSAFSAGIFWFVRPNETPLATVKNFLGLAASRGVDTHIIVVPTFDELAGDLLLLRPPLAEETAAKLKDPRAERRYFSAPPIKRDGAYPVLRLNAIPVTLPSACRLIVCRIGGASEVHEAVADAQSDVVVARRSQGILAFGSDDELRRVFGGFGITEFDLFDIEERRFAYDSAELGLCYDALVRALARERPLIPVRPGRTKTLKVDANCSVQPFLGLLLTATGTIGGTIPGTSLAWAEAIHIRLQQRLSRTWLCFEPTVWAEHSDDGAISLVRDEFLRNRRVRRYNRQTNELLVAWEHLLTAGQPEATVQTFGPVLPGVDACFHLVGRAAHSRRDRT